MFSALNAERRIAPVTKNGWVGGWVGWLLLMEQQNAVIMHLTSFTSVSPGLLVTMCSYNSCPFIHLFQDLFVER